MMAYITINKTNFFSNLDYFKNLIGSKDKLSIGLKDNAYGHGIIETATLCKEYGVQHVFVKNLFEANQILNFGFKSVQVLYEKPQILTNFLITINCIDDISNIPSRSLVELKIDTGMHRNGIDSKEITKALTLIKQNNLNLVGVFSHFCCADEDNDILKKQEKHFLESVETIKSLYKDPFNIHIANTAGTHKVDNNKYDKVRIGIGVYGYIDIKQFQTKLKPVLSLYSNKISTRILHKGDSINYGSKAYIVSKDDFVVSNYDIGYGDGFFRLNEHKKSTVEDGREILGRVSMDSISIRGDDKKICIFSNCIRFAHVHNTIVYEILTNLSPFLERRIVEKTC